MSLLCDIRINCSSGQIVFARFRIQVIIWFRRRRFLSDIFNTMLDVKWRYVHMAFFVSFIGSWLFFALIWWVTRSLLVVLPLNEWYEDSSEACKELHLHKSLKCTKRVVLLRTLAVYICSTEKLSFNEIELNILSSYKLEDVNFVFLLGG